MSRKRRSGDDFTAMLEKFFAETKDSTLVPRPEAWLRVPNPPVDCPTQVRRINDDGSITYVSEEVKDNCNVWRDYYDQYGYRHTIPEPDSA